MRIAGEFEIIKREALWDDDSQQWVPGNVIETVFAPNEIRSEYQDKLRENVSMFSTTFRVYISEARSKTFGDFVADGWLGTLVDNGTYTERNPVDPRETAITLGYWTWRSRFDPPSSGQRDISAIVLRSTDLSANNLSEMAATAGLTEICVQTDSQIIDVFYRVYIDDTTTLASTSNSTISDIARYSQVKNIIFAGATPSTSDYYYPYAFGFDWWPAGLEIEGYGAQPHGQNLAVWNLTNADTPDEYFDCLRNDTIVLTSTEYIGYLFGSSTAFNNIKTGPEAAYAPNRTSNSSVIPDGTSVLQSTFGKVKTSNLPYLDIDNQAVGIGTVDVTETTPGSSWDWEGDEHYFAGLYRILITTSGDVGTAEYKIAKAIWPGSGGNTFSSHGLLTVPNLPNFRENTSISRSLAATPDGFGDVIRHGVHGADATFESNNGDYYLDEDAQYVQGYNNTSEYMSVGLSYGDPYDATKDDVFGITLYDMKGRVLNLNKFTFPAFVVTDIRQVVTEDDGTIWVACSDTGLWKIVRATTGSPAVIDDLSNGTAAISSITRITTTTGVADNTICRGVQVETTDGIAAAGATLWAIFDKEMCTSSDSGATWTVYNAGSTPEFVITGVTGGGDDASGIMHFVKDHHHATKERFFLAVRANEATTDGQGYWWSTDATDTPSGTAIFVDVDATAPSQADFVTHKIIGTRCVYAGQDGDWYFAMNISKHGIARYAFNGTNDLASYAGNTSISTRAGQGINVYFDENGDDWIVGYDHTNSDKENIRGYRPQNSTSASTAGTKVLCWRISNSTGSFYDDWLSGLACYLGSGFWLSHIAPVNYSTLTNTSQHTWLYFRFYEDERGGMDTSGVVTDDRIWTEYGWEGSPGAWVEGGSGSKVTHGAVEDLVDGLSIAFTGGTSGAFDDGDMYDAYAYPGILKDNATTLNYVMHSSTIPTVAGTDFVTTTVPAAPVGAVTNELMAPGWLPSGGQIEVIPGVITYGDYHGQGSTIIVAHMEQVFTGDFTLEFCINNPRELSGYGSRMGLLPIANAGSNSYNFTGGWVRIDYNASSPTSVTRRFAIGDGTGTSVDAYLDVTTQKTNSAADDYFLKDPTVRAQRIGTTITWDIRNPNGSYTNIHSYTSISDTMVFGTAVYGYVSLTAYNVRCSYTPNTYHTYIGNNSTTGPGDFTGTLAADDTTIDSSDLPDVNFRSLVTTLATTYNFKIEVDTTGGGNWVERTIITDPYVALANTEVRMLRSGKVEFHADDASRTFRGNWIYNQRQNLT